jgi:hypothetical protein
VRRAARYLDAALPRRRGKPSASRRSKNTPAKALLKRQQPWRNVTQKHV